MIALFLWLGCTSSGGGADSGGADSGGADSADPFCADAPVVTWESWGEGFMVERCQSCHASTTLDRNGAPESVTFDTHEQVIEQKDRILARATGKEATMPPSGGVTEDDKYLLEVWLQCWEE